MADEADQKKKLQRAMARMVACKKQLDEHREKLQEHASARLDAIQDQVKVGSQHMARDPNILTHRYTQRAIIEAARLRALALRAEHARAKKRDDDSDANTP